MDLLFQESAPIPTHALAAVVAVILGGLQLASTKGDDAASYAGMDLGAANGICEHLVFFHQRAQAVGCVQSDSLAECLDSVFAGDGGVPRTSRKYPAT